MVMDIIYNDNILNTFLCSFNTIKRALWSAIVARLSEAVNGLPCYEERIAPSYQSISKYEPSSQLKT